MPTKYFFLATDLKTGLILADLPDLIVPNFKTTLGRYEAMTAQLPLPTAPDDWERITLPGASVINLLSQRLSDDGTPIGDPVPVGGAAIVSRKFTQVDTLEISLATLESYFDRRMVDDENYSNVDQNTIVQDLIETYVIDGPNGGPDFRVEVLGPPGVSRDREYKHEDDKTVYSVLTDLMSVIDGPEWYIGWETQTAPQRITPVVYVGSRVGTAVADGFSPLTTFEMPGSVIEFEYTEDYSSEYGANSVVAVSSGQGDTRPESDEQVYADTIRPTFEYRWTPSTSIVNTDTLDSHAERALVSMEDGSKTLSLSVSGHAGPQIGVDWNIGDDVGYQIGGAEGGFVIDAEGFLIPAYGMEIDSEFFYSLGPLILDEEEFGYLPGMPLWGRPSVPAFPKGLSGTARVIGWEIDFAEPITVEPILILNGE